MASSTPRHGQRLAVQGGGEVSRMPAESKGERLESPRVAAPLYPALLNLAHDGQRDAGPLGEVLLAQTQLGGTGDNSLRDRRPLLAHAPSAVCLLNAEVSASRPQQS